MTSPLVLAGCNAQPLSSYLKALGVLRLVTEHSAADPKARGSWQGEQFVLTTELSEASLADFFLQYYQPTPLIAPWNGSTGFYPKDNSKTLDALGQSKAERLALYRQTIQVAQDCMARIGLAKQPQGDEKQRLLTQLRNRLPNEAIRWLDTCVLITGEALKFPPLTGSGGNDGNFEFSRTFMQQLQQLFDFETGAPLASAKTLLSAALFDQQLPSLAFNGKIGQFNPGAAGGTNAAPGQDGDSQVNPWDFVLMLEGIVMFVAGATRRHEQGHSGNLTYPFMVRPSALGYGSAAEADKARAELWAPLWERPAALGDVQKLFHDARVKVQTQQGQNSEGLRPAEDGVDFFQAVSRLSQERGLSGFVRYSFQERNGLSYFAIPLGRIRPGAGHNTDLLSQIDRWRLKVKSAAQKDTAPASIRRNYRQLEHSIVAYTTGEKTPLVVMIALGALEASLSRSLSFAKDSYLRPVPRLTEQWLEALPESEVRTPEFRLALTLAGSGIRQRLVQVRSSEATSAQGQEVRRREPRSWVWAEATDNVTTWQNTSLTQNLLQSLQRDAIEQQRKETDDGKSAVRETEQEKDTVRAKYPTRAPYADLGAIAQWIDGTIDEARLEALVRAFSLINLYELEKYGRSHQPSASISKTQPLPLSYALVKFVHSRLSLRAGGYMPQVPGLLQKLSLGEGLAATKIAANRLQISGFHPVTKDGIYEPPDRTQRLGAALAFPISHGTLNYLLCRYQVKDPWAIDIA